MMETAVAARVLITGVSRGLGRAMLHAFAAQGMVVCGCCRSKQIAEELSSSMARPHSVRDVDVTQESQVADWARELESQDALPDLLVNNAALINRNAPLWDVPVEEFHKLVEVNVSGVYHMTRHFVPKMMASGEGVIVNFSSAWGRTVAANVAPYCATKWAIEGMTKALALEIPAPLAAIAVNPGVINTDMLQSCFGEGAQAFPTAEAWVEKAVSFLLALGREHNGMSLNIP